MGLVPEQSAGTKTDTTRRQFGLDSREEAVRGAPGGGRAAEERATMRPEGYMAGRPCTASSPLRRYKYFAPREPTPLGVQLMEGGARVGSPEGRARRGEGCRFGCRSVAGWRGDLRSDRPVGGGSARSARWLVRAGIPAKPRMRRGQKPTDSEAKRSAKTRSDRAARLRRHGRAKPGPERRGAFSALRARRNPPGGRGAGVAVGCGSGSWCGSRSW